MTDPEEANIEEVKTLRLAIMELIEVCKRMTLALGQQLFESKATLMVLENNIPEVKNK